MSSNSKIQKYSPTESAKVYDKAVNRKNNIHFHPRQTIDFIANNMAHATLTNDVKRRIVRQYLDVSNEATLTQAKSRARQPHLNTIIQYMSVFYGYPDSVLSHSVLRCRRLAFVKCETCVSQLVSCLFAPHSSRF